MQAQGLMNIQWYISECQHGRWGDGDVAYVNLLCCSCSLPRYHTFEYCFFSAVGCFDANFFYRITCKIRQYAMDLLTAKFENGL